MKINSYSFKTHWHTGPLQLSLQSNTKIKNTTYQFPCSFSCSLDFDFTIVVRRACVNLRHIVTQLDPTEDSHLFMSWTVLAVLLFSA